MSDRIELSKSRAKRLVRSWDWHVRNEIDFKHCPLNKATCPLNKYFKELRKKTQE